MRETTRILFAALFAAIAWAQTDAWQTHRDLASQAFKDKKFDVAEREGRDAYLESLKAPCGAKRIALTLVEWGDTFVAERKFGDAEALYRRALARYQVSPVDPEGLERARQGLARALAGQGVLDYNRPQQRRGIKVREALSILAAARLPNSGAAASDLNSLGVALEYDGYYHAAQRVLLRSIALKEVPIALTNLGEVERRMGLNADAEQHLQRAVTLEASTTPAASPEESKTTLAKQRLYRLGLLYGDQGQYDMAEAILKQALDAGRNKAWNADIHRAIGNGFGTDPKATRYVAAWAEMGSWTEAKSFFDLTDSENHANFNAQKAAGLTPFRRWTYATSAGSRNAAVWVRGPAVYWYTIRTNKAAFLATRTEFEARGYSLVHVAVNGADIDAIWWQSNERKVGCIKLKR